MQKANIGDMENTALVLRPEYAQQLENEKMEITKGKKKKDKVGQQGENNGQEAFPAAQNKKKKGGKSGKKDPVDSFDPLNFKRALLGSTSEVSDLKTQLAHYEFKCSTCPFGSNVQDEFKSHFKCEWHKINTQRKVAEQEPLTEDQFKELVLLKEFA